MGTYLLGQLATFWQGEIMWHGRALASPPMNLVYTIVSLFLPVLAIGALFCRTTDTTRTQREALWFSFASFVAPLAFFAFLSVIYDFHDCPNPSREHPYFKAGRMMLGMLIPFLLLFVFGLDRVLSRFGHRTKFFALGGIILFMVISEIAIDRPVFSSQYNWFHM
jgi:hypothetical protein